MQENQTHARAVIWIDHLKAKIFSMGLTGVTASVVRARLASSHLHHKANSVGSGRVPDDGTYLPQVADTVEACSEVLIMGPGNEKAMLLQYLQSTRPDMVLRLETSDHPSDGEIIAVGRKHVHLNQPIDVAQSVGEVTK
jgi:hypothetical protein